MRMQCEVIDVQDNSESLTVGIEGKPRGTADWYPSKRHVFHIPATQKNKRAFYIGRHVEVTIKPA